MKIEYPDKLYRGISNKFFILDGVVTENAFVFDPVRDDGYCEMSITWGDDKEAFETIMSQISPRTNTYQFQGGTCEISREDLHVCMKAHFIAKRLCYEKKATISNKYYGNILMKNDIDKQMQKLIRFGLATIAGENIKPNPNVC